ncbi:hypothetical protein [Streptomyces sp. NBC_00328]|uniref:hypothetical protein n=1 Tax=Streptomyces sp. NBC_00328 TaxID=2903646 RepID=UPI002E2DB8C5|nr:hypothetical protein [Streptomyces sp. NBC_00328]
MSDTEWALVKDLLPVPVPVPGWRAGSTDQDRIRHLIVAPATVRRPPRGLSSAGW